MVSMTMPVKYMRLSTGFPEVDEDGVADNVDKSTPKDTIITDAFYS